MFRESSCFPRGEPDLKLSFRGRLLLCIIPSADADPLHSVKWHPKQLDTLAVASETKMYLLDLADAARTYRGEPLPQVELNHISQVFTVPSVGVERPVLPFVT